MRRRPRNLPVLSRRMGRRHAALGGRLLLVVLVALVLPACSTGPEVERVQSPTSRPAITTPAPAPRSRSAFGVNSQLASRYPNFATLDHPAAVVADLKPGWVREDVQWSRVEPRPGAFDWSWHDTVFERHARKGISIIGVITPAVGWATPEPGDPPEGVSFYPPDPDRYAAFARAVAERYRGVVQAWEIWNEPENPLFWRPNPDPAAYAQLLTKASAAIKAVDPAVVVLSGGVVPYDPGFLQGIAAAGAWDAFDALAVHPYVDPAAPESAQIDLVGLTNVRQLAARYGDKPIWVTEYGWTTGPCERDLQGLTDEEEQANYLVRAAVLLRSAGAERVLWYTMKDEEQPCYGLARSGAGREDYRDLKPAATALRVLSEQIGSARPLGAREVTSGQVILAFEEDEGWGRPFPPANGSLIGSTEQAHGGAAAAKIAYRFDTPANDYVALPRTIDTPLPIDTARIGLWVYGDGSGHMIQVRIVDGEGEVLQYRLGFIGPPGWQFLSAELTGSVEEGNRITAGNGRLDDALRLREVVVDDQPNAATGSGTIFVDDVTVFQGLEGYARSFTDGRDLVDVVWAAGEHTIELPVTAARVAIVDRQGTRRMVEAEDGRVRLVAGPAPLYVRQPGAAPQASTTVGEDELAGSPGRGGFQE